MHKSKSISSKENRIDSKFNELKSKNQKALICYVVAGYPDIETSENMITSLINGGADIIEIGIPFFRILLQMAQRFKMQYRVHLYLVLLQICVWNYFKNKKNFSKYTFNNYDIFKYFVQKRIFSICRKRLKKAVLTVL